MKRGDTVTVRIHAKRGRPAKDAVPQTITGTVIKSNGRTFVVESAGRRVWAAQHQVISFEAADGRPTLNLPAPDVAGLDA